MDGGIIGVCVTFSQRRKHPRDNTPKVKRRMTVGVFHGSGPCGPIVKATAKSKRPETRKNNPTQSNSRKGDFLLVGSIESMGKTSGSAMVCTSSVSWTASGCGILGTKKHASAQITTYKMAKAMNGAFQLNWRAKAPEPRPPIIVAAGVPIKKEEKTRFLRRHGSGYTRLKIPTAIGTFAAQAIPVRPDITSRTMPFGERDVDDASRLKAAKLVRRRVFRGRKAHVSAMWPKGSKNAPVVRLRIGESVST